MCKNIKKMDTQADALKNSIIDQTTSGFDVIRETAEDSIEFLLKIQSQFVPFFTIAWANVPAKSCKYFFVFDIYSPVFFMV